MKLSHRQSEILREITSMGYADTIKELATRFKVGERSIRYDIQSINEYLREHEFPILTQNAHGQLTIKVGTDSGQNVLHSIDELQNDMSGDFLSKEQRRYALIAQLLLENSFMTLGQLAQLLGVSRNTLIGDLEQIKDKALEYKVQIHSVPKHGISIKGIERRKRRAYIRLLSDALPLRQYAGAFSTQLKRGLSGGGYQKLLYEKLIVNIDFSRLEEISSELQNILGIYLSDISNTNLVVGMAVSLYRADMGQHCTEEDFCLDDFKQTKAYHAVEQVALHLEKIADCQLQPWDLCFITQCILSGDLLHKEKSTNDDMSTDRQIILSNLIAAVSADIGVNFTGDKELISSLNADTIPAFYRISYGIKTINPHLNEIKKEYGNMFEAVKNNILPLRMYMGLEISDHEISFLTMHFIASLERSQPMNDRIRVVVMCGLGFGSANLLISKLNRYFSLEIVKVISLRDFPRVLKNIKADLIISSVAIDCADIPWVHVSPLLPSKDIEKINQVIMQIHGSSSNRKADDVVKTDETENMPGLLEVISFQTIDLNFRASSFLDAIFRSGELLLNSEIVREPYVYSMIEAVEEIGPYIVFSKGVALAHSNAGQFVNKVGVSMVRLSKPVISGHPDNDPVSLLFAFASTDNQSHTKVMMDLGCLISFGGVEKLMEVQSPEHALEVIENILKEHGN